MQKNLTTSSALILAVIFFAFLVGCTSNIKHIPKSEAQAPKSQAYNASVDAVWNAAKKALVEDETFKILDKSSGIMVTELRTIDAKELSLAATYFLGKTYKNSYTINFNPQASNKTDVTINVKLQAVQVVLLSREESNADVEGYLRKKLFDKIAENLKGQSLASTDEANPDVGNKITSTSKRKSKSKSGRRTRR
jgi:uncharacterized protein (UPF0333 family)